MNPHTLYSVANPPISVGHARQRFDAIDAIVRRENSSRVSARYRAERKFLRAFLAEHEVLEVGTHDYEEAVHMHALVHCYLEAFGMIIGGEPREALSSEYITNEILRHQRRELLKSIKEMHGMLFKEIKDMWLEHKGPVSAYYRACQQLRIYGTKLEHEIWLLNKKNVMRTAA